MIKRSFFGLKQPSLEYTILGSKPPALKTVAPSRQVRLFSDPAFKTKSSLLLKPGDAVKTGEKLAVTKGSHIISTVTGKVAAVSSYAGDFGKSHTSVTIDITGQDDEDEAFEDIIERVQPADIADFFQYLPGGPLDLLLRHPDKFNAVVVCGVDDDLLTVTRQFVARENTRLLKYGIKQVKNLTGIDKVYMAVPDRLAQEAVSAGAEAMLVDSVYPSASPRLIVEKITGRPVPADKSCQDEGFFFISAEALIAAGHAFSTRKIPRNKVITLTDKYGRQKLVSARVGTMLKDIFDATFISVNEGDRIIVGGPMTGAAVYSLDFPICPDTDAVIVQDRSDVVPASDSYCINCGECVRICPAGVPVNLLVRFLESGAYEEAADNYDLDSCIDCGLCSYVCTAGIPIFHYIKLGKFELSRIQADAGAEEENV